MHSDRDIAAMIAQLNARVAVPHKWGRDANDCLALVIAAVHAQTGTDPLPGHHWSDKATAVRLLHQLAQDAKGRRVTLRKCIEAVLDARFDRIAPAAAMRGDIAGVPPELVGADPKFGMHPMIVEGAMLCSPGSRGLFRVPRSVMVTAWDAMSLKVCRPASRRRGPARV